MSFFNMGGGFPFGFPGGMEDDDDFGGFGGFGGGARGGAAKDVDTTKLYKVMEVEKTASQDEIRRSYKKLALKKHPDRGGSQEGFQELQHAYEILSDETKRKVYDQYGEEGLKEGRDGFEGGDIFDLLHGRSSGGNQKRKTKPVLHTLNVTLEDIYKGNTRFLEINRYRNCATCKGTGSKDPKANTKCTGCQGKGMKVVVRQISMGYIQQTIQCPDCKGEKSVIKEKDKCPDCKGEKVKRVSKVLEVSIDKGSPDGKRFVFPGESDEVPGVEAGDVVVEILIQKHKKFHRKGADLVYTADISLLEALTGFELLIEHLDGRKLVVKSKPKEIIKPGVLKTVKECGMPFFDAPYKYGNLYINFNIVLPDRLDSDQKASLASLFPKLIQEEIKEQVDETYTMTDFKIEEENTHYAGGKKEQRRQEEDEEDEDPFQSGGARKMQCQNQ